MNSSSALLRRLVSDADHYLNAVAGYPQSEDAKTAFAAMAETIRMAKIKLARDRRKADRAAATHAAQIRSKIRASTPPTLAESIAKEEGLA